MVVETGTDYESTREEDICGQGPSESIIGNQDSEGIQDNRKEQGYVCSQGQRTGNAIKSHKNTLIIQGGGSRMCRVIRLRVGSCGICRGGGRGTKM